MKTKHSQITNRSRSRSNTRMTRVVLSRKSVDNAHYISNNIVNIITERKQNLNIIRYIQLYIYIYIYIAYFETEKRTYITKKINTCLVIYIF